MIFSSIIFLFHFLPFTLAAYYIAPPKAKNTVLFICSLVFYCWGEVRFFPVMLALILINYLCGLAIAHFEGRPGLRRLFLGLALVGSLGMLFYFKYANFVLESANALLGTSFAPIEGISVLPLGISFYTFQTLSYTIDVYRRDVASEKNIIDFGAYVVMFPQLIAGPIVKYRDVAAQLHVYKHRYNIAQIEEGMTIFTFGLAKKVLLADAVGALWTDIIGVADDASITFVGLANASTGLVWLGILAYSFQLYFDFSGYSMMAIGMGKMMGFEFPQNFNYPYISASITEFWRRWHMTLSSWFREYVYIPLGGNRRGLKRQMPGLAPPVHPVFCGGGLGHVRGQRPRRPVRAAVPQAVRPQRGRIGAVFPAELRRAADRLVCLLHPPDQKGLGRAAAAQLEPRADGGRAAGDLDGLCGGQHQQPVPVF